jgi:hypothetical protein
VFHIFPLTQGNQKVIDLFYQHVQISNQDEVARERVLYLASGDIPTKAILTDYFGNIALGKLTVEQSVGTSSYLAYSIETEGVDFNKLGLRPGDEIRTRFDYDAAGNEIYTTYKVDSVINSGMVRLVGKTDGVNEDQIPLRFEIWRTETNDEFADSIANTANCSGYLVRYIRADNANPDFDQIQAAAGLIGLIGSVVPHQGVSWYEIPGLTADNWVPQFSKTQLDHMAGNGVLLIVEMDGVLVARHAVTANKSPLVSDVRTNLNAKLCEEMWIRNMLLLKKEFRAVVRRGYVGVTNMVAGTYSSLQQALESRAALLENSVNYPQLGGRITGGLTDLILQPHAILADHLWVSFHVEGPLPMNGLDMTIYC